VAAELYKKVKRDRDREIDITIAACAIAHSAELWTVNPDDFKDIPDLKLL
jgi:predicted nucleic acid-binding protein